MPGQPEGQFDVTKLEVLETVGGVDQPSHIVDAGESIRLRATITGQNQDPDFTWTNLRAGGFRVRAQFYSEGMGPWVWNQAFGTRERDIDADTFTITSDAVNAPIPRPQAPEGGLYRCGVVVNVVDQNGNFWFGWLGFNEDCVLQVSPAEQP